jgi:hypothetical protein
MIVLRATEEQKNQMEGDVGDDKGFQPTERLPSRFVCPAFNATGTMK